MDMVIKRTRTRLSPENVESSYSIVHWMFLLVVVLAEEVTRK